MKTFALLSLAVLAAAAVSSADASTNLRVIVHHGNPTKAAAMPAPIVHTKHAKHTKHTKAAAMPAPKSPSIKHVHVKHAKHTTPTKAAAMAAPKSRSADGKKFAKVAHLKATPWDAEPKVKAEKCEDLCFLQGFYTHQEGRNCNAKQTALCTRYTEGKAALATVLETAECTCDA